MADATLVSLLLSPQVQGAQSSGGNRTATGVPPALLNLAIGTFVTGTVASRDGKGTITLRTDKGEINIKSELALKPGAEIVLRIEGAGDQLKARIVTVDGKVPQTLTPVPQQTDTVTVPTLIPQPEQPKQNAPQPADARVQNQLASAGQSLLPEEKAAGWTIGVLIKPASGDAMISIPRLPQAVMKENSPLLIRVVDAAILPTAMGTVFPSMPAPTKASTLVPNGSLDVGDPGVELTCRVPPQNTGITVRQPLGPTQPTQYAAPAANPVINQNASNPSATVASQVTAPNAPVETARSAVSTAAQSPPSPTSPPLVSFAAKEQATVEKTPFPADPLVRPLAAERMQAYILSREKGGDALLQTPIGIVRAKIPENIPAQSTIVIEVKPTPAAQPLSPVLETESPVLPIEKKWNTLQQALTLITQYQPALAAEINRNLPQPDHHLGNAILFLVKALKGSGVKDWLGQQAIQLLEERGHGDLLQRLNTEFANIRTLFQESAQNQWQTLPIPVLQQNELQTLHWHMKREQDSGGKTDSGGTRFVVELELSQLGAMQMDGFVRRKDKAMAFDLMVRTQRPLPQAMQDEMTAIFLEAGELTRFQGQVLFQVMWNFPVQPIQSGLSRSGGVMA